MDLFAARDNRNADRLRRIRGWVEDALHLEPDATVLITELRCHEPDCPPVETVIGVLRAGVGAQQFKISKAAADVVRADIAALWVGSCPVK